MRNYQKLIVKNKRKKMPKCSSTITHFTGVDNSISPSKYKQYQIQWTLSIITTLYLQLLSISNKKLGPLDICVLSKLFLSLYLELLYLEQKSWSLATISLSISNFFPSKGPFTQQIEQKCSIFENSNVIKTFEIRKFDCNQNITKCKGFVLN